MASRIRRKPNAHINCAVCFNRGKRTKDDEELTIVKGYAVCADHVQLVSQPGFDIFSLLGGTKKPV
jgi:hypothetical protein